MQLLRASTEKKLCEVERPCRRAPMGRLIRSARRQAKPPHALKGEGTSRRVSLVRGYILSFAACFSAAVCSFNLPMTDVNLAASRANATSVGLGDQSPSLEHQRVSVHSPDVLRPSHPLQLKSATITVPWQPRQTIVESGQEPRVERLGSISLPVRVMSYAPRRISPPVAQAPQYDLPAVSNKLTAKVYSIIKRYAPQHKYPKLIAETIVRESAEQRYDPLFVAAVIKSESAFNNFARSHKGAQGLMQIMPATGAWIADKENLPQHKLSNPEHNVRLGISYLKHLEEEYAGDKVFTLVAYNWGPGHVESASGGKRRIPKECLTYAVKILSDYRRWKAGIL